MCSTVRTLASATTNTTLATQTPAVTVERGNASQGSYLLWLEFTQLWQVSEQSIILSAPLSHLLFCTLQQRFIELDK
jgi:bifunctional pyridoxal-dependent enzyme with beta-cystathionase and maltose regulon repressor activities|nr:hypothetical protein [Candidatus Endoriftia persephone]